MGHIPDECSHQYTERFRALLVRYQHTVRLSMFGHTHTDVFKSVLSFETDQPVGVLTVCGSMTTWGGLNPSFCVYDLDKDTLLPVSRQTWSFDVATSNLLDEPNWSLSTDWISDYNMKDLSPSSYVDLAIRFLTDSDLT
jgi:sphingomyelin phosphodiesterase